MAKSKMNDERSRVFDVTIRELNDKGAGVAEHGRHQIVVPKTLPGEKVRVEYDPSRDRKQRIRLLEVLEAAKERVEAPCQWFSECGGCHLQHLPYPQQLQFKHHQVTSLLAKCPRLNGVKVHAPEAMPEPFYYRNKTQMPYLSIDGAIGYGLYKFGSHEILPIDQCMVEHRDANQALKIIAEWAEQQRIPIYNESNHEGLLRYVLIRKGIFSAELMVVLVVTGRDIPYWQELLAALKGGLPALRSFQLNINRERTNVILGEETIPAWGEAFIREQLGKRQFRIYPQTFFQVNSVQAVKMLQQLKQISGLQKSDHLVDLYCGVGAIALSLANAVETVTGIEKNADSVQAALDNATDNGVANVQFICDDARAGFQKLLIDGRKIDGVTVDPPRKGLTADLISEIVKVSPRWIGYISCNPATLISDLDHFASLGYHGSDVFLYDMLPQTYHVECLTVLRPSK